MKSSDRYQKIVEWSTEDGCYVGRCPDLMLGGVHGADKDQVYDELCAVVEAWMELDSDNTLPLEAGDYLTRPEFERCYSTHTQLKKAELIDGIVYIPPPTRVDTHGDYHFDIISWLGFYRMTTPGIRGSDNATVRFDFINEPQPDVLLRLDPAVGGNSWIDGDGYLQGAPELVVEVAASSTSYDLHQKKATYARHGVQEYLVLQANAQQVSWFSLRNGAYEEIPLDADGILRSRVFPGLWFHAAAFWADHMADLLAVLQQGIASPEYSAFREQLST